MDRVAAEITQEVCMFFEDQHGDSGPGQEQSQHHASGTASGDARDSKAHRAHPVMQCLAVANPECGQ
jgi:hypothetical protein